jgi:hypothetical protein
MSHSDQAIPEQQKEEMFQETLKNIVRPITNVNLTHYIELGVDLSRGFERKEFHGTLTGCRIVLPYLGHLYEVLINPIAPIEEVKNEA